MAGFGEHLPMCRELGGGGRGGQHQGRRETWADGIPSGSQQSEDQTANTPRLGERPCTAAVQRPRRSGKHGTSMRRRQGRLEIEQEEEEVVEEVEEEGEELGRWWRRSRMKEGEGDQGFEGEMIVRFRQGKNVGGMAKSPRRWGRSLAFQRMMHFAPHRCFLLVALAAMQTPLVAGQNCTAGQVCCQIPPCLCGTYIACGDAACSSASCEQCPSGGYCDCDVACSAQTGVDQVKSCPKGYFCPAGSGWPTPCPENTYSEVANAKDAGSCIPCKFAFGSGRGSQSCQMTTIALVIICCGSFGFICITSMCAYGIRRYLQNRRRGIQEFEEEYRRTQYLKMHRGLGGAEGIGPEMDEYPEASAPPMEDLEDEGGDFGNGNGNGNGSVAVSNKPSAADKKREIERRMRALEEEDERIVGHVEAERSKAAAKAAAADKAKKPQRKPRAGGSMWGAGSSKKQKQEEDTDEMEVCV